MNGYAALRLLQARHDDVQSAQALMATMGLSQLVLTEPDARDMRIGRKCEFYFH